MSVVVMVLWLFGLGFIAILWLGFAASLFEIMHGVISREPSGTGGAPKTWGRGLIAGAMGYAIVVMIYGGLNLVAGRNVFLTPALLGESLMGRAVGGAIDPAPVLVYNGLHLAVFLAIGIAAAWLLLEAERHPKLWYPGFVLLLVVFFHAIAIVLWIAAPAASAVPAWSIVFSSAIAGIIMAMYLLYSRPETLALLRRADLES